MDQRKNVGHLCQATWLSNVSVSRKMWKESLVNDLWKNLDVIFGIDVCD